jgi:hypothetical protein
MALSFSCICLTYARVWKLKEAIGHYLAQDFTGESELIVFNTCPQQTLHFSHPKVRVFNCETRPQTLGEARNMAIAQARGSRLILWDDDDVYLPWHIRNYADFWPAGCDWVWISRAFLSIGDEIRKVGTANFNTFAYTKEAWEAAGKYAAIDCGEDKEFYGRMTQAKHGQKVDVPDYRLSFVYAFGNGVYHISGSNDTTVKWADAYKRVALDAKRRFETHLEPTGQIDLEPSLQTEGWKNKIAKFMKVPSVGGERAGVCLVQLGRYGDVINILPIARMIHERFETPHLMVASAFADVLDGVSYVKPHVLKIPYEDVNDAIEIANREYSRVIVTQVYGRNYRPQKLCETFTMESWRLAGFDRFFADKNAPLVFDRRSPEREAKVLSKVAGVRPLLLMNFTAATSAPFRSSTAHMIERSMRARFDETFQIVDLGKLRLERLYDLLCLMEKAAALVSVDTALLHLAGATGLPIVALLPNNGWAAAIPRSNVVERILYKTADADPMGIVRATEKVVEFGHVPVDSRPVDSPVKRTIYHVTSRRSCPMESRISRALQTWDELYARGVIPVHVWDWPRNSRNVIGDSRDLPFLKDILQEGMNRAGNEDIIFFTNDDIAIHSDIIPELLFHVGIYGATCAKRCEWTKQAPSLKAPLERWAELSGFHMGRDMFALTKSWLLQHWSEIPDFCCGTLEWDLCLAAIIRKSLGIVSTDANIIQCLFPAEMKTGYIGHEYHKSPWAAKELEGCPSWKYNKRLFREWKESNRKWYIKSG